MELDNDQVESVCKTIIKWMRVCEDNGRPPNATDVAHSALLRRLLRGGTLHESPPPRRMGYPHWAIVENEETEILTISEYGDAVYIDQDSGYTWEDKEKKVLRHNRLGLRFQYSEREVTPDAKNLRRGLNPEDHKYTGMFLKKLNED